MKKNQVDIIFNEDSKRKQKIIICVLGIITVFVISFAFLFVYFNKNKVQYVKYDEASNVDYKVYLKNNDFFDDTYLEKNNQYISSLVDYIKVNFNYKLSLGQENVEYKYSYRIEANIKVTSRVTNKNLYNYTDILLNNKEFTNSDMETEINEWVNVDYNKYNELIKRFVSVYNLDNADSYLTISMYVKVLGSCEDFTEDTDNESVTSLVIPLTNNDIGIDITNNLINNVDNVMICGNPSIYNAIYLILFIFIFILGVVLLVILFKYIENTRSAKGIYDRELKKILNNYRSYIQKVNSKFDLRGYQVLKIDTFSDMLEIRDTVNQPILMVENQDKSGVYFIIPTNSKLLYTYCIKVSDIQKKMDNEN